MDRKRETARLTLWGIGLLLLMSAAALARTPERAAPEPPRAPAPAHAPALPASEIPDSSYGRAPSSPPLYRTREILVTAPPIVQEISIGRLATALAVVSSRQIDDLAAQDLASGLRRVPGVVISRYNPIGSYGGGEGGSFTIRGQGSGRPGSEILTLYDDVPRVAGIWTHPLLDVIPVDAIDRIEIEKSAQPVLTGNMAFASVNVVPKRRTLEGFETRLQGAGGKYETGIGVLEHGGKRGRFDYFLAAASRRSEGHRRSASGLVRSMSGRAGVTGGVAWGGAWDLSLEALHTDGRVQDPGSEESPWPRESEAGFRVPTYRTDDELYIGTLAHRSGRLAGQAKLYFEDGRNDWLQWDAPAPPPPGWDPNQEANFTTLTTYRNYGLRLREAFTPRPGAEIVAGLDASVRSGEAVERWPFGERPGTKATFRNTAPYVLARQTLGSAIRLTPSAGFRFDSSREFGEHWGWQAGLTAGRGRSEAYANHARAYNLPGAYVVALYDLWNRPGEWKGLEAETLDHTEVGLASHLGSGSSGPASGAGARLVLSAYYDEVREALRFVPPVIPPPPPFQPPRFENRGGYIVRGLEANVACNLSPAVELFTGGTYSRATPETVPNLPEWTWVSGLAWTAARALRVNLDASWVGPQYVLNPRFAPAQAFLAPGARVEGHFLLNGRAGYQLPVRLGDGSTAEIFLSGENLTNERYAYRPGYPMPRTAWLSGIDLRF